MAVGELVVERTGEALVVALHGEHDLSGDPRLRSELARARPACSKVIVALSAATFIDRTVLAAVVDAHLEAARPAEAELAVIAPASGFAKRLLVVCGLDARIPIFETRADALAAD